MKLNQYSYHLYKDFIMELKATNLQLDNVDFLNIENFDNRELIVNYFVHEEKKFNYGIFSCTYFLYDSNVNSFIGAANINFKKEESNLNGSANLNTILLPNFQNLEITIKFYDLIFKILKEKNINFGYFLSKNDIQVEYLKSKFQVELIKVVDEFTKLYKVSIN